MDWIEASLQKLLRSDSWIKARIEEVCLKSEIESTKAQSYCYCLKSDANGNPRVQDLAEFVWCRMVDYAIPKKEIDAARKELTDTGSSAKVIELSLKAKGLFTHLKNTWEGWEMLLYILIQEFLGFPQLLSKMSLKTSSEVHYHGVDWIHVNYNKQWSLELYWGESKMYADINQAMTSCFNSIKGFLLDPYGHGSTQARDLQLINSNLSNEINDSNLEDLLVRYFDKDDDLSNSLIYKGVCFIGFDYERYPTPANRKTLDVLKSEIESELWKWNKALSKKINGHPGLESFEIHVFLIPFPSVEDFRNYFLNQIA